MRFEHWLRKSVRNTYNKIGVVIAIAIMSLTPTVAIKGLEREQFEAKDFDLCHLDAYLCCGLTLGCYLVITTTCKRTQENCI